MSLDVYLNDEGGYELYWANITHNLCAMAKHAGIYECLWRPDEIGIKQFNSPNDWGKWENFLPWCARLLQACKDYPEALVKVSI
jgi:hypothetical protein